jgi:prepilin-type N-terminal cleavage/methylation domain-containing protein
MFMNEKGMTLIEVLASIVILSIIVVSLLTFFVQSSRTNSVSKNIISATYVAEKSLEEIYETISKTYMLSDFITANPNPAGFTLLSRTYDADSVPVKAIYEKNESTYYIKMELESAKNSPLVKVKVKVYTDSTDVNTEAQMEMLLAWKKIGI